MNSSWSTQKITMLIIVISMSMKRSFSVNVNSLSLRFITLYYIKRSFF